jgi:hypothetical protein
MVNHEERCDELRFELETGARIEQGNLEQIVLFKDRLRNAEILMREANGRDTTALAVAAVMHLEGRSKEMFTLNEYRGGESDDATAAFRLGLVVPSH